MQCYILEHDNGTGWWLFILAPVTTSTLSIRSSDNVSVIKQTCLGKMPHRTVKTSTKPLKETYSSSKLKSRFPEVYKELIDNFHIHTVHLDIIEVFFLFTNWCKRELSLKKFKIYIKIYIKTAPICFGAVTPSSGSALLVLAKVIVVKIAN